MSEINQELVELAERLKNVDSNDFEFFIETTRAIVEKFKLIFVEDIVKHFGISRPTVDRWIKGKNAPHPYMRPCVFAWYKELISKALRGE